LNFEVMPLWLTVGTARYSVYCNYPAKKWDAPHPRFFCENRCQRKNLAYTSLQMVGIKGLDVKKLTISFLHVWPKSNGSLKLP
jgi:hypothetical protein